MKHRVLTSYYTSFHYTSLYFILHFAFQFLQRCRPINIRRLNGLMRVSRYKGISVLWTTK